MNKYIKNIAIKSSIVGILAMYFVSCDEKILDKNPLDQISSPTFWKTQEDADFALAGVYSRLLNTTFNYYQMYWDVLGGDLWGATATYATSYSTLAQGEIHPTSGGIVSSIYSDCYKGIASCNLFLDNIDKVPISDQIKTKYKGEVLFLRALFYFTLADFYGGVPLYIKPVTVDEAKIKQSSKADVLKQVHTDLDVAIASLPDTDYSVTGKGHAVKGSALALKAKVCLSQYDWEGAVAAASQIISDGKFSLYNNYRTMFLSEGQDNNSEIMFSTRYLRPDFAQPRFFTQDGQFLQGGFIQVRNELVDAFESGDPRLALSIKTYEEGFIQSSGTVVFQKAQTPSETGWLPTKTLGIDNVPVDMTVVNDRDWVLLRYAEVLMIYAEAKNEISGPDASVYDAINQIRARPGINMPPIPTGLTQDSMRTHIQNERRVEFCMEGKRYSDMKRWKLAETYFPTLVDPTGVRRRFDPAKHYVFPFPQSEIDANPNLVQNPGY